MRTFLTSLLTLSLLAPNSALALFPEDFRIPEETEPVVTEAPHEVPVSEQLILEDFTLPMLSAVAPVAFTWNGEQIFTRATFMSAVVRRLYKPTERCFAKLSGSDYLLLMRDVPKDAPYGMDLCTAMRAGLVRGFRDGTFRPNDAVTVAEAAKVLAKAFGMASDPMDPTEPWADPFVKALVNAGALSAHANLQAPLTRDELSAMLWRLRGMQKAE